MAASAARVLHSSTADRALGSVRDLQLRQRGSERKHAAGQSPCCAKRLGAGVAERAPGRVAGAAPPLTQDLVRVASVRQILGRLRRWPPALLRNGSASALVGSASGNSAHLLPCLQRVDRSVDLTLFGGANRAADSRQRSLVGRQGLTRLDKASPLGPQSTSSRTTDGSLLLRFPRHPSWSTRRSDRRSTDRSSQKEALAAWRHLPSASSRSTTTRRACR